MVRLIVREALWCPVWSCDVCEGIVTDDNQMMAWNDSGQPKIFCSCNCYNKFMDVPENREEFRLDNHLKYVLKQLNYNFAHPF